MGTGRESELKAAIIMLYILLALGCLQLVLQWATIQILREIIRGLLNQLGKSQSSSVSQR